jgi:AraC-like DNA-binding protein
MEDAELFEKKQHGNAMRPFAKYDTILNEDITNYHMHWHEEIEVIRVQSGRGIVFIDGKRLEVSAGDILIVNPYLLHSLSRLENESMTAESVVFDLRMLESTLADACTVKYLAPLINRTHLCQRIIRTSDPNYGVFNDNMTTLLMSCNDKQEGYELAVKANLMWLFYHLYNKGMVRRKTVEDEEKYSQVLKTALDYIQKHASESLTVGDIAAACGYSEAYMMKLFKRMTGSTCVEYINSYRLKECAEMLLSTNDKILDIAYSFGFNNISYFNLQFKRAYGMTPKEYRAIKGKLK